MRRWLVGHRRVALHHVAIGEYVGSADVEPTAHIRRHRRAADQVVQDVADGDRLDPGAEPAWGDHYRQAVGQVPQHLERRRAGPENHGRAQHRDRYAGCQQNLADLAPGIQVRREFLAFRVEPAEIDDARYAGLPGRRRERQGVMPVACLEPPAGAEGVDQVVGDVHAVHRPPQLPRVPGVRLHDLDLVVPGPIAEPAWVPCHRADPEAGLEQLRHEAAADVAGDSGDEGEALIHASPVPEWRESSTDRGRGSWLVCGFGGGYRAASFGVVRQSAMSVSPCCEAEMLRPSA